MSIYRPQEVRYIKLDSVKQERALFRNYWNEIINQYGIDIDYYRRNTNYVTPHESSAMLYGHNNVAVYDKVSKLRAKVDFNTYDFLLNEQGFMPSDNLTIYFAINDFATSFVDSIGRFNKFPIISKSEGEASIKNGCIRIPFETRVYSGTAVIPIERGKIVTKYMVEDVDNPSKKCLSVAYNPYIHRSFATDYKDGYFSLDLYCDYDATKSGKVKYKLSGNVLYSDFYQDENIIDKIHPNVGDVIEINYHTNDMDVEQYEITEMISRKPTMQDGISPFLGKCVYKCTAIRRIPSHESSIKIPEQTKKFNDNIMDFQKKRSEAIEDTYNWEDKEHSNDSKYYGGYQKNDAFKDDTQGGLMLNIAAIFNYDQWKNTWPDCELVDGYYILCTFNDGSVLKTDGINLYWYLHNGEAIKITDIPEDKVDISEGIPNMMYVRAEDGQLIFYTADMDIHIQLTNFEHPTADSFQYFPNFSYKDVGYISNDGYYIFKNNKIAINSIDNKKLVACNGISGETFIIKEL